MCVSRETPTWTGMALSSSTLRLSPWNIDWSLSVVVGRREAERERSRTEFSCVEGVLIIRCDKEVTAEYDICLIDVPRRSTSVTHWFSAKEWPSQIRWTLAWYFASKDPSKFPQILTDMCKRGTRLTFESRKQRFTACNAKVTKR